MLDKELQNQIRLNQAKPEDALILSEFAARAFFDTFARDNSAEDMSIYIESHFGPGFQKAEILDPSRTTLIAWAEAVPIGYVQLLRGAAHDSVQGPRPIELLRLYVDQTWQGRGVAHLLMTEALEIARQGGFETVWLGVWEKNHRALKFYEKWGFEICGAHDFILGRDRQNDLILQKSVLIQ